MLDEDSPRGSTDSPRGSTPVIDYNEPEIPFGADRIMTLEEIQRYPAETIEYWFDF